MHTVKVDLPRSLMVAEINTIADPHIGDRHHDAKLLDATIKHIKDTESAYVILNGDLLNNAIFGTPSDAYSEQLTPTEQLKRAMELFAPIRDKILLITDGNHEFRGYRQAGIMLTELLAGELKLYDRYAPDGGLIFLRLGEMARNMKESNGSGKARQICYMIYATHGRGGGRKAGAKAIRLEDMAGIVDADIYIHSHTHMPMVLKEAFYRTDPRNNTSALVDKLFVNTAAMLEYGGYGQANEYKPNSTETPIIYLDGRRKYAYAKL